MRRTLVAILLCLLVAGCSLGPSRQEIQRGREIQCRIDALVSLHRGLDYPEHFSEQPARKRGGEFDVMRTLESFPRLRVADGYVLDYAYYSVALGGEPVVYARKTSDAPFPDLDAFMESVRERAHLDEVDKVWIEYRKASDNHDGDPSVSGAAFERLQTQLVQIPDHDFPSWYLRHIVADDTDDGYIELAALSIVCGQFYLAWHGSYNDSMIVLTKDKAVAEFPFLQDSRQSLSLASDKIRFSDILFCPRVSRNPDAVEVSLPIFSRWGGLSRATFSISRLFPHQLVRLKSETIIYYDCGICY